MEKAFKLDGLQIEAILDKLVPLIAKPEDHGFFRALLEIKAEESTSGQFACFVNRLLKTASARFRVELSDGRWWVVDTQPEPASSRWVHNHETVDAAFDAAKKCYEWSSVTA